MRNNLLFLLFIMTFGVSCKGQGSAKTAPEVNPLAKALNDSAAMRIAWGQSDSVTIGLLDEAISIDSNYVMAYSNKVAALNSEKNYREGLKVFEILDERGLLTDKPTLVMGFGLQYSWTHDKKRAHEKFVESLTMFEKKFAEEPTINDALNMLTLKRILAGKKQTESYYKELGNSFEDGDKAQLHDICKSTLEMTDKEVDNLLNAKDE